MLGAKLTLTFDIEDMSGLIPLANIPPAAWLSIHIGAFFVFLFVRGGLRWQTLKNLRGPPPKSWLLGHQLDFYRQRDVGELDFTWHNAYGGAWKIDGCFGVGIPSRVVQVLDILNSYLSVIS